MIERTAVDEWTVDFDDGEQAWRDHHELRPRSTPRLTKSVNDLADDDTAGPHPQALL